MGIGQEGKNKKFSKENNVSSKGRHASSRKKGMNNPSRKKMLSRFIIYPTVSSVPERHVVQHKKFPQKLIITQKKKNAETESYGGMWCHIRNFPKSSLELKKEECRDRELWRKYNSMKHLKKH